MWFVTCSRHLAEGHGAALLSYGVGGGTRPGPALGQPTESEEQESRAWVSP